MSNGVEQTLIVIKPDAVKRGLIGEILSRFERRGFIIRRLEMISMSRSQAEEFYSVHKGKPFFNELISFIISGPVVGAIIEGIDAIATARRMIGSTKSWESPPGTIRGDLALGLTDNVIHASDSKESFIRERNALFKSG